jgi:hypothetical protein
MRRGNTCTSPPPKRTATTTDVATRLGIRSHQLAKKRMRSSSTPLSSVKRYGNVTVGLSGEGGVERGPRVGLFRLPKSTGRTGTFD